MTGTQQFCFTHPSHRPGAGEDIYLFALHNNKGTTVHISNYGAIITSLQVMQADGRINDIVLGFDDMRDYLAPDYLAAYPWFGAAIGRYGNRIKDAAFRINEKYFTLSKNKPPDHLHGGEIGYDKKVWKVTDHSATSITMALTDPDKHEGYPGTVEVSIRFELNDNNELSYQYIATADQLTPINLTHHGYFNLDTTKQTINKHLVKIYSDKILEQDKGFVTTGKYIPVAGTFYDFHKWKSIDAEWNEDDGYDQSYATNKTNRDITLLAEVRSPQSGLRMEVWSTEPLVHFYTGQFIPAVKGKNGVMYGRFSGFCLETQVHPNAVNIPHFPNTILKPGEVYRHKTIYKIFQ
jgi:aldose 1-epimerase